MLRVAQAAGRFAGRAGQFAGRAGLGAARAAGHTGTEPEDSARRGEASEYVVALALAFQIGVLPVAALVYAGNFGGSGSGPILALCAVLVAATVALGFGAARGVTARAVLLADTALAVAGNLAMSRLPGPAVRAVEVSWQYFAGCVALWTLMRGVVAGLGAVALGVGVRLAMFAGSGTAAVRAHGSGVVVVLFGDVAVLLIAVLVAAGLSVVLDRDAERLRADLRRSLHDTVLQTLEAIALTLPGDADNAARRLREVRAIAHAEAVALRHELSRRSAAHTTPSVVEGLVGLGTELARDGLRMRLEAAEGVDGDDGLTPQRRAAVLAAAREALRNVLKHSGVSEALVRVWDEPDGLTLVVRDFGAGFDPAAHRPGFGLSESIAARMAEVGGTAGVGSRVGNGTSVTLWVPVQGDELR